MRQTLDSLFLSLAPDDPEWSVGFPSSAFLSVEKQPYGPDFGTYVDRLAEAMDHHITAHQPDIIHAHHLGFGASVAFSRVRGSVPMISVGHGTDVIAARYSAAALDALREIVAASAVVVLPTRSLRNEVDVMTGMKYSNRLEVIPWGIPAVSIDARHHPGSSRTLNLLHSGRLDANKSTITAIESLCHTAHGHRLTIIGDGSSLPGLHQAVVRWGLEARVRFEPFLPRPQLWRRFAEFDALLFTTRGLEAFGLVAIEAQAHGLPVIYSAVEGVVDAVGDSGLAYAPGDPQALAAQIDVLAESSALRADLSRRAIANAARYPLTSTAAELELLTRKVLRGSHVR
ncbi:glycosyltransferase family 4 protein [Nocardia gipuzkoensis]